jgi:hypothetical protein
VDVSEEVTPHGEEEEDDDAQCYPMAEDELEEGEGEISEWMSTITMQGGHRKGS